MIGRFYTGRTGPACCYISLNLDQLATLYKKFWMDELGFYVPSTVFQSFRDDGRVNMKGSVQ